MKSASSDETTRIIIKRPGLRWRIPVDSHVRNPDHSVKGTLLPAKHIGRVF